MIPAPGSVVLGLAVVGALLFVGFFQRSIQRLHHAFFVWLAQALRNAREALAQATACLARTRERTRRGLGFGEEYPFHASFILGAGALTGVFLLFLLADLQLAVLTIEAMEGIRIDLPIPVNLGAVLVMASVLPGVFGFWYMREIGDDASALIAVRRISTTWRRIYQGVAVAVVLLSLITVTVWALFRAEAMAVPQAEAASSVPSFSATPGSSGALASLDNPWVKLSIPQPGRWERLAPFATMLSLGLAVFLGTALAAEPGPVFLLAAAPLAAMWISSVLVAVATWLVGLCMLVLEWAHHLSHAGMELLRRVGIVLARPLVVLFLSIHDAASASRKWSRLMRALVLSASSWAQDVELPPEGIGQVDSLDSGEGYGADAEGFVGVEEANICGAESDQEVPVETGDTRLVEPETLSETALVDRGWNPFGVLTDSHVPTDAGAGEAGSSGTENFEDAPRRNRGMSGLGFSLRELLTERPMEGPEPSEADYE